MKKYILPIVFLIAVITMLCYAYYKDFGSPFKKQEYETIKVTKVLKSKYCEVNTVSYLGNVQTERYFLYEDGYLEHVNIATYMSFNDGDTLNWHETIKIK